MIPSIQPPAAEAGTSSGPPRGAAILAVPVLITVHAVEELLTIPRALSTLPARVPEALRGTAESITPRDFAIGLAVVTLVPWALAILALAGRRIALYLLLVMQAAMLVNVASHLGSAVMMGAYAPGLVTALALNLPFSLYLLRRVRRERWIGTRAYRLLLPLGLVAHGPLLIGLMWILAAAGGG